MSKSPTPSSANNSDPVDVGSLVTTYVLAFGPEFAYLRRCLVSIWERWPEILPRTHVIAADPEPTLAHYVDMFAHFFRAGQLASATIRSNPGKYVVMREEFYETHPPETPWVQWFDSDSFVKPDATIDRLRVLLARDADVIGSAHQYRLRGNQGRWATAQPWARGQIVPADEKVSFSVGGWWLARVESLACIDYPWPTLRHRGGDVMLGLAGKLNGFLRHHMGDGVCPVAINADWDGRPHRAVRRGKDVGGIEEEPVGVAYVPGADNGARPDGI